MSGVGHAYLHGFASGRLSTKGQFLRERLAGHGIDCVLLDGNVPSFERMTYSGILEVLDDIDAARGVDRWRLIGSSMGGYLVARWAELNPKRADRLVLLCPGFDLARRWPLYIGAEAMARWQEVGHHEIEDGSGTLRPLHWEFLADSRRHPAYPEVPCPTLILHGTRDEVVPVEFSRNYARDRRHVRLVELDDDHALHGSLDAITDAVVTFSA